MLNNSKNILLLLPLLFLLAFAVYASPGDVDFKFEHIGREQGLNASSVMSIIQDHQGFMWFGTTDGLYRYDGYGMTAYKHDPKDSTSLGNNYIWTLLEDTDGNLWVGTSSGGLNRFDRKKEQFVRYRHDPGNLQTISSDVVTALCQDQNGNLWAGTIQGLNKIDLKSGKIRRYVHDPTDPTSLNPHWIFSIFEDDVGTLWLGTEGGLSRLDIQTGTFEHFVEDSRDQDRLSTNRTVAALIDQAENVWFGSHLGLNRFDRNTQRFTPFSADAGITSLLQDRSGVVWIGTTNHLLFFDPRSKRSTKIFHQSENPNSLSNNRIQCIYEDRTGALWFGTRKGVNRFDRGRHRFKHIRHDPGNTNSLSGNGIAAIHNGHSGNIWVANWGKQGLAVDKIDAETKQVFRSLPGLQRKDLKHAGNVSSIFEDRTGILWFSMDGLGRYNPKQKQFKLFVNDKNDPYSLIINDLEFVYEDRVGRLWIAIYHYGPTGISMFDRKNGRFTHINLVPEARTTFSPKNGIAFISEGRSGRLWFATKGDGIFRLDPGSDEFIQIKHDPDNPNSLSHNWVKLVHEDRNGILWAAPWSSGLTRYDPETGKFTVYSEAEGLAGSDITSLVEDDNGYLWLTTQYALSRFDPFTETFKNFDRDDGLLNDGFPGWKKSVKGRTGEVFFGGANGIDYLHPDSIQDNPHIPPVVFTKFIRFNSSEDSGQAIVEKGVSEKRHFDLSYEDNTLTFEFAALNYRAPHKNQYAYKLEGFNDEWIHLGNRNNVTFTNLDPGEYILRVKGSNNDGIWNEEGASLFINISPPWWQTSWAYAVYILLIGLTLYGIRKYELKRVYLRNELEKQNFHAQKLQEVDQLKSRFFANISHEFRTPLTLILGPLQKFLSETGDKEKHEDLRVMHRNALRLKRLIDQLLDLSKIEAKRMPLKASPQDIIPRLREWTASFSSLAESKKIDFDLKIPADPVILYFDSEKMEKIVFNLLSNAFKFTPEGGKVELSISKGPTPQSPPKRGSTDIPSWKESPENPLLGEDKGVGDGYFQIKISNTGAGIAPEQLHKIFDRFYSINEAQDTRQSSTGIGLALTKEFVDLHHGKIDVTSEPGKSTVFTVSLPLGRDHLSDDEIVDTVDSQAAPVSSGESVKLHPSEPVQISDLTMQEKNDHSKILIVEDNPDMRRFLVQCLNQEFNCVEAENGISGFKTALEQMPDLVVSDVMMPEMDGFQLCDKLKTDARTSHIPVVLLTARASTESKVEGLETGADDYLVKPFDAEELIVRVKNLISQRKKLRQLFSQEITVQPKNITVTSIDEKILQQAIDIVEKNISNSDFHVDQFCAEMAMSRSTLNRKLRALTGNSTNEFIRTLRLKRAAQLLQQNSASITEIAFEVGFNNPSYFAECFREQFGKSPSEYISS